MSSAQTLSRPTENPLALVMTVIERPWQGIRWAVHRRALITADNADTMPPSPWMWPRSKDPSSDRWLGSKAEYVKNELTKLGGVFGQQEEEPVRYYDLAEPSNAARLFAAVGLIDPRNTEAVVHLIKEWGLLGVGMTTRGCRPSSEICCYESDSLQAIVDHLELFQQHAEWLVALQARDAVALRIALRKAGLNDAASRVTDRKEKWRRRWLAFSHSLGQRMSPIIQWDGETEAVRPAWILRCPKDVLWAKLWDLATQGARLRRCENKTCRMFFVATDLRRQCCSRMCSKRKAASDWYWKRGGRDRRKSRRTTRTRRRSRR